MSQEEGLSTRGFDSNRGDLSLDSVPKVKSPGVSNGRIDSDRGDLSLDSVPKAKSPGGGFGPKGVASKSLAGARAPYLPARSLAWDLAGVERWVRRPFGIRPGVPCELRLPRTWVFLRTRSPRDDD